MAQPKPPQAMKPLKSLFASDPERLERLGIEAAGIYFDWSKTHLDEKLIDQFAKRLADSRVR